MPPKPSPERDKAKEIYLASGGKKTVKEIAAELEMPEKTISCWKYRFKWEDELRGIKRTKKGKPSVHPSRLGNKNAVGNSGGGAPPNNKNALKHGAYEEIKFAHLTERERALVSLIPEDTITQQRYLIAELEIREQRLTNRLSALYEKIGIDPTDGQTDVMLLVSEMQTGYSKKSGDDKGIVSTKLRKSALEMAMVIEESLTKVQNQKQKAIDSLERMLNKLGIEVRDERKTVVVEERLKIERERVENEQKRWEYQNRGVDANAATESIAAWNRATHPTEDDIKALFADDTGEQED